MRTYAAPPFDTAFAAQVGAAASGGVDGATARHPSDTRWRPHDLLRLRRLPSYDGEPDWVRAAFAHAPFAVVRRASAAPGFIAVGMRGNGRAQRYGTWAQADDIEAVIAPEDLLGASSQLDMERLALPAFAMLYSVRDEAQSFRAFSWGPTGSAGFELATGTPTVTATSDLDLLIRTAQKLSRERAAQLLSELESFARHAGIRVDVQLETPSGGIALAEWAAGKARVMVRHAQGPRLVSDPWAVPPPQA
jgi:phosphoribosyl-dephospho-CoA transferase